MDSDDINRLIHYGIKGMKWGVRKGGKTGSRRKSSARYEQKDPKKLTDKQLKSRISRMENEKKYSTLNVETNRISSGAKAFRKAFVKTAGTAVTSIAVGIATTHGRKYIEKKLGLSK